MEIAELAHQCADRVRLRFPRQRGNEAFFGDLRQAFIRIEGVYQVTVRPRTTSVIVEHDPDPDILERLQESAGFTVVGRPVQPSLADNLRSKLNDLDSRLRGATENEMDLRSAFFVLFAGVSIIQIMRGYFAPTALAAAWTALKAAQASSDSQDTDMNGGDGGNGE